jgi:hypothetical protein
MATRKQAEARLTALGLVLDLDSGKTPNLGWSATIDAPGRQAFGPDCRGHCVVDGSATAATFWNQVIREAESIAPTIRPCPYPEGECDFHDPEEESRP